MLSDFLTRAALAGLGTALAAGPLGCFVVWRRMAYFGDATAHAAILGVALALALDISIYVGVLVFALAMGLATDRLSSRGLSSDTALGVLSHSALAVGIVAVAFVPGRAIDLEAYLFGDILTVSRTDLAMVWGGAAAVLGLLIWQWSALLTATVAPDLATASGIDPARAQLTLILALSVIVGVALKVVGVLLIAALLVIPAAAARGLIRSPEAMAVLAAALGCLSVGIGLGASLAFDSPAGPSIVCAATVLFLLSRGAAPHLARLRA
ncbi:MAG: metal ABC transporter permease [Pseudomonadota bacterium]